MDPRFPRSADNEQPYAVMKLSYPAYPISAQLLADCDPEYAASEEYRTLYPDEPRTWRDGFHDFRRAITWGIGWPLWRLGEAFEAAGNIAANTAAVLLRVNVRWVKHQREDDE